MPFPAADTGFAAADAAVWIPVSTGSFDDSIDDTAMIAASTATMSIISKSFICSFSPVHIIAPVVL